MSMLIVNKDRTKVYGRQIGPMTLKEMNLIVSKKNVYGVERVYPICTKAKLFASISGYKTLLPDVIELIKKLGYNLTTESEKI